MKWKSMLTALVLSAAIFTQTAYAAGEQTFGGDASSVVQIGGVYADEYGAEEISNIYPVSITLQQIGETPYITKVYEVGDDVNAEKLVKNFEQDGYNFIRFDILMQNLPGETETKRVSRTVTAAAASDDKNALLAVLEPILDYNEGGYAGQLMLDVNTISFTETGRSSYRYTIRDTREYTGLDRNDAAYIAKTVQKNGVTLTLESVDWQITGQTPVDGGFVPNLYNAVATYSGAASGSRADGYTATVTYTGEVSRALPGNRRVSVIYRGEIPEPEPEPAPVPAQIQTQTQTPATVPFEEEEPQKIAPSPVMDDLPLILGLTAAGAVLVFGTIFSLRFLKKQRRTRGYNSASFAKRRIDR